MEGAASGPCELSVLFSGKSGNRWSRVVEWVYTKKHADDLKILRPVNILEFPKKSVPSIYMYFINKFM